MKWNEMKIKSWSEQITVKIVKILRDFEDPEILSVAQDLMSRYCHSSQFAGDLGVAFEIM